MLKIYLERIGGNNSIYLINTFCNKIDGTKSSDKLQKRSKI